MAEEKRFTLEIPVDASGVKGFKPDRAVKVVAFDRKGTPYEEMVKLDAKGKGSATLSFSASPGSLRVALGPETASAEDLKHLQTISVDVPSRSWGGKAELKLPAVAISAYYWWWWFWWCRDFKITGRLLCPDGSPVPGAQVCAYDLDWWWWWISEELVGCAITDANGAFEIDFRRCCGWFWWWWWELRVWQLEPFLADRIVPVLQKIPGLRRIPIPDPAPDLQVFESLLSGLPSAGRGQALSAPAPRLKPAGSAFDPAALESLRGRLVERLPAVQELERFCLWPWCPWWPWWDCDADIIFRATQNCGGQNRVVLSESILQVRLDIPTQLNVTLVANSEACCLVQPCQDPADCPQGACTVPFDICSDTSANVGGNPGASAAAATIGYERPGLAFPGNPYGDRPYAENVVLSGIFGDAANVDYYEFEYAPSLAGPWSAMPPAADGGFGRAYWTLALTQVSVPFNYATINSPDGPRNVFESRQHYEANNSIGIGWDAINYNVMMVWQTLNNFPDGAYYLRLKGWTRLGYVGDLSNKRIVPFCETAKDNYVVITLDNRVTGSGSGHPTDHPCGAGTVHICTTEPDCNIIAVRIDGTPVGPCGSQQASGDQTVEIDLMVHDPDGHLAYYTLASNYGLDLSIPLIYLGGSSGTLGPGPGPSFATSWIGPAAQVGPDYGNALAQGAASPSWAGGTVTFSAKVKDVFPETCCYQLQLWAYKRTIADCYYGLDGHANVAELSFTIIRV